MIFIRISFFGHRDFIASEGVKRKLTDLLTELSSSNDYIEFFFGGYGSFDSFAYSCVKEASLPDARRIFVTPYITESYQKNHLEYIKQNYDEIIYPEIENVPLKFAITARNRWMVEQSDLIIFYVGRKFGGAYDALLHSLRSGKKTVNLGGLEVKSAKET